MSDPIIVLIGALIGAIPGIYAIISGRQKAKAEAHKARAEAIDIVGDAAVALIQPLNERVTILERRVKQLEAENEAMNRLVRELRDLIRDLWECSIALTEQLNENELLPRRDATVYCSRVEKAMDNKEHK